MDRASFEDVLGTNYAPSYNERCSIRSLVESMEQEVLSLNQVLLPLLAKRDKLNDRIRAYKDLLTPARRLLHELVSEIFIYTIHSESSELPLGHDGDRHLLFPCPRTPLKLGGLCRRWRQIALSTPSLWSAVGIPTNWGAEGLKEWISRAGSRTLSFCVDIHQQSDEVLNLLAGSQQRWKAVVFYFDTSEAGRQVFGRFLESLSCSYAKLQTLHIHHVNRVSMAPDWSAPIRNPSSLELTLSVHSATHLRSLLLDAPYFRIFTPNTLQFLYLREINFGPTLPAEFLTLLQISPAIEVVYVCISHGTDSSDSGHAILKLANLKHLDMFYECDQEGLISSPLEELDLPALEWLSFNVVDDHWRWGPPSLPTHGPKMRSLIYRSRPPLKVLRIQRFSIPAADVMYCIPFLPDLSCLEIEHIDPGDDCNGIVQLLTGPIPPSDATLSGCMCPKLSEITFGKGKHSNPDLVIKMILSRIPMGSYKLSRVNVLSCWESDVLVHPNIQDCVKNGLQFEGRRNEVDDWGV